MGQLGGSKKLNSFPDDVSDMFGTNHLLSRIQYPPKPFFGPADSIGWAFLQMPFPLPAGTKIAVERKVQILGNWPVFGSGSHGYIAAFQR